MKPADLLFLLALAIVILLGIGLSLIIFRKRKRMQRIITRVLLASYFIFCITYPSLRAYMHAQRYDALQDYLQQTYPDEQFTIEFREYKYAIQFGDFDVSNKRTPNRGVTYRVEKHNNIMQLNSSWQK